MMLSDVCRVSGLSQEQRGPGRLKLRCRLQAAAVGSAARGASAPTEGGEGRGHIVAAACLQLVVVIIIIIQIVY